MIKQIGIIGITGRMGNLVANILRESKTYRLSAGFGRQKKRAIDINLLMDLDDLFSMSDYVIDFSTSQITGKVLKSALRLPKPLIICTTGWESENINENLDLLAQKVPIVIAPNTSLGANLQLLMSKLLARILSSKYDIDIDESHHRQKIDIPSGTAKKIEEAVILAKKEKGESYFSSLIDKGPRPLNYISLHAKRSGQLPGEHEISFTSKDEAISIKHKVFNRELFAKEVLKILDWLKKSNPQPGIYNMLDVLGLDHLT